MVADAEERGLEVRGEIVGALEHEAHAPEECDVGADGAGKRGAGDDVGGAAEGDKSESGDGGAGVGLIDVAHLAQEAREAGEFFVPTQVDRRVEHRGERDEVREAGEADEERGVHGRVSR